MSNLGINIWNNINQIKSTLGLITSKSIEIEGVSFNFSKLKNSLLSES